MKTLEEQNIYQIIQQHFADCGDAIPDVVETSFGYNVTFNATETEDILYIENIDVLFSWAKLHNMSITMTTMGRVGYNGSTSTTFHLHNISLSSGI